MYAITGGNMKTIILLISLITISAGCATPPTQPAGYTPATTNYQGNTASYKNSLETLKRRKQEAELRKELAKTQEELEEAKRDIEELRKELEKIEAEIKAEEAKKTNTYTPSSGSGTVYTGPRGGQYTISPSGKKVYKKR